MSIRHLTPGEALACLRAGALLIDVRGDHERALGMADGARGIERAALEADPGKSLPDLDAEIVLVCQRGQRSQQCALVLQQFGYRNIASVVGGTEAWDAAGLPMQRPDLDALAHQVLGPVDGAHLPDRVWPRRMSPGRSRWSTRSSRFRASSAPRSW